MANTATRTRPLPVTDNGTEIGAIVRTAEGTWEGWLLTADRQGYVPLDLRNQPEFGYPTHARDAVVTEYNRRQSA